MGRGSAIKQVKNVMRCRFSFFVDKYLVFLAPTRWLISRTKGWRGPKNGFTTVYKAPALKNTFQKSSVQKVAIIELLKKDGRADGSYQLSLCPIGLQEV